MKRKSAVTFSEDVYVCFKSGCFEGYASIFNNLDSHKEVVMPGAFKKSLAFWKEKNSMPKMLWQHNPEHVIGVWVDMFEDSRGLYVKGKLFFDVSKAREVLTLMQNKVIDSLSIGYHEHRAHMGMAEGKMARFLTELDLLEVSLVTFPSNPLATVEKMPCYGKGLIFSQEEVYAFSAYVRGIASVATSFSS